MVKMTDMLVTEKSLVVICAYKFLDFQYDLLELGEFKRYCDVHVWDISMITSPKYYRGIGVKGSEKNGIIRISSLLSFIRNVYALGKRSNATSIYILNLVPFGLPSEAICNLIITAFLRKKCVIVGLYNGGVPVDDYVDRLEPNGITENASFYSKVLRYVEELSTLSEVWKMILGVLTRLVAQATPVITTHRLVAGEHWFKVAKRRKPVSDQVRFVFGHSSDYSNNLLYELRSPSLYIPQKRQKRTAVLLDGGGPMYGSDFIHMGRKVYYTAEVWYPALVRFFDRIEDQTGVRVEVAAHYKASHPAIAPCFGNRSVHYGKTRELVRNSEFVITRASTAISYAVVFKKPVIFIYSNQLKDDHFAMKYIFGMAAMLGNDPVNIDEPPIDIQSCLKIDEERYRNYKRVCLTSTSSLRPNSQIILEDIMNIDTGSDFIKEDL